MATPGVSPEKAEFVANVIAGAADQYLISYLVLTRFEECGPYSIGFALAHCLELSIKAVYWQEKKAAPDGHRVDVIIKALRPGVGDEFEKHLPDPTLRARFSVRVDNMNAATPMDMLTEFFELNPNFDDEKWMFLYAIFRSMHVKYGVDKQPAALQLLQPVKPKLNKMALKLIGCARESFPSKESHRRTLADFIEKLPKKYNIAEEVMKLAKTGKAQDTPDYMKGLAPPPPLLFDSAELNFLKKTFGLASKAP